MANMKQRIGSYQPTFEMDDKVKFTLTDHVTGTGVILGKGLAGLVDLYIVGLDKPYPTCKALLIPSTLLEKIA